MKKIIFLSALFAAGALFAGKLTVDAKTDHADGIYKCREIITVSAQVTEDGKPVSGHTVKYEIKADGQPDKTGKFVSDAAKPQTFQLRLNYPGAMRAEFEVLDADGKRIPLPPRECHDQARFIGGRIGAVADPYKIVPGGQRPADFDAFWAAQIAEAAKVPMKVLEKKEINTPNWAKGVVNVWDMKISCAAKRPVSGYFAVPVNAKPKSLPAMLFVHGAGVGSCSDYIAADFAKRGAIVFDINAHGLPNGQPRAFYDDLYKKGGELYDYYDKMYPSREEHYFRGITLRLLRALEFLRSQPEWNGRDLIIYGASQGGWQALVGAALDPSITLCCAGVPAFADFDGEFSPLSRMPRMHFARYLRKAKGDDAFNQKMLAIQSYYDTVNFATRIKAETYISVGYLDLSSPTTSVYGIYNRIPATTKKHIQAFPGGIHAKSPLLDGEAAMNAVFARCKAEQK